MASAPTSDSPSAPLELLRVADLLLPAGVRLHAVAVHGASRVRSGADGRRTVVFATPGAEIVMFGLPTEGAADPESATACWAITPDARPVAFQVTPKGDTLRLPGAPTLPDAAFAEPGLAALRSLLGGAPVLSVQEGPVIATPLPEGDVDVVHATAAAPSEMSETQDLETSTAAPGADPVGAPNRVIDAWVEAHPDILEELAATSRTVLAPQAAAHSTSTPEPVIAPVVQEKATQIDVPETARMGSESPDVAVVAIDEAVAPTFASAGSVPTPEGVMSLAGVRPSPAGAHVAALVVSGEPPVLVQDAEAGSVECYAAPGATFVLAHVPDDDTSLESWYATHPEGRPVGLTVGPDGALADAPTVVARVLERVTAEGRPLTVVGAPAVAFPEVVATEQRLRHAHVRGQAVGAAGLASYLTEHHDFPPALMGRDGSLFVPVHTYPADGPPPEILAVGEGSGQGVLAVVGDDGTAIRVFAPTGAVYWVRGTASAEPVAVRVTASGDCLPLSSSERARVRASGVVVSARIIGTPRSAGQASAPTTSPEATARRSALEPETTALAGGDDVMPDDLLDALAAGYAAEGWGGEGGDTTVPAPDGSEMGEFEPSVDYDGANPGVGVGTEREEAGKPISDQAPRGSRRAERDDAAPRWRTPYEGAITIMTWMTRSPRGEFWASELLECAVEGEAEMLELDCLVQVRLFRMGHRMGALDKLRIQDALTGPLKERVDAVRVFQIERHTYFARETALGVKLIGPYGRAVKDAAVRQAVAASYGRPSASCFVAVAKASAGAGRAARRTRGERANGEARRSELAGRRAGSRG